MKKNILIITLLTALFLNACKESPNQENKEIDLIEVNNQEMDGISLTTYIDNEGNKLEITYDNKKGIATFVDDGKTIDLEQQKSASGFWYKNEIYELLGKADDVELKKNGNTIFSHEDDIRRTSIQDKDGQILNMTFNNTKGTVKVYLNGGQQIDLVAEKAASGIWYKNDQYELRGKGENLELKKEGKTIFKN